MNANRNLVRAAGLEAPEQPAMALAGRRLINLQTLNAEYAIPRSTAYELHKRGCLEFLKLNGRTLVTVASVEAFVATLPRVSA